MAQRQPRRYESVIDRQIRLAAERGEFDDLPGAGKPIPGAGDPPDELWWVRGLIRREGLSTEPLLPISVRLRKELDRLPETVVALPTEQAVRAEVADLNRRVAAWIRTPSGPPVRLAPARVQDALAHWHEYRRIAPPGPAEPAAPTEPVRSGAPWWRRQRRRRP